MTRTNRSLQRMADWARLYFSAGAVVRAIKVDRDPRPDDLRRLGIDPRAFLSLGHG